MKGTTSFCSLIQQYSLNVCLLVYVIETEKEKIIEEK